MELNEKHLPLGAILSISWNIVKRHILTILAVTLIIYIPIEILLCLIPFDKLDSYHSFTSYVRVTQVLELLFGVLATMGIAFLVENHIQGRTLGAGDVLKKAVNRWPSAVGTNIIAGLIIMGLTLLLIIPGVIWSVYYIFRTFVVVLRMKSGSEALKYSKSLVVRKWWKVFGYTFVFGIVTIGAASILGVIVGLFWDNFIVDFILGVITDIMMSFFIVAQTVFFLNLDYTQTNPVPANESLIPETSQVSTQY
jgi:hypothetical protein